MLQFYPIFIIISFPIIAIGIMYYIKEYKLKKYYNNNVTVFETN